MFLEFDDRESDSPYVERIWRSRSRNGGSFLSMAEGNIELVVTRLPGFLAVTLRGPVSRGSLVECPPNGEWLAVRFRLGTYLPRMPTAALIDHQDVQLPVLPNGRFWFSDLTWEIPTYDNAEAFAARLVRAWRHRAQPCNRCSRRRRCRLDEPAFGSAPFSPRHRHDVQQLSADPAALLSSGSSVLNATFDAGYFDQAHLTRSVKQLIGMTPARLVLEKPQLSFSYKTTTA